MEADGHVFSGVGRTPDAGRVVALEHGVIGEKIWQVDFCGTSQWKRKRKDQEQADDSHV
jgi:hypothetical protein